MAKAFKKAKKKKFLSHFYIFWGKINFLQISVVNNFFLFLISLHQILKKLMRRLKEILVQTKAQTDGETSD